MLVDPANPTGGSGLPADHELDQTVIDSVSAHEALKARILNAPKGVLGLSATGLAGSVEANITALLKIRSSLDALIAIAGVKADEVGETWQGIRPLLRTEGKASPAEITGLIRAASYASTYPVLAELWVEGDVSRAQVRRIGDLASKIPGDDRDRAVQLLADHAPGLTDGELANAARVLLNAVSPGCEEREAELAERKAFVSLYPDGTGYSLHGFLTAEQAGWLQLGMDALTSVIPAGDTRSRSERQAEALVTMCRQYASSDEIPRLAMARPRFVVLATATDLIAIANDAAPGDLAMTMFGDRLDPLTTRRLLSDADIVPVVAAEPGDIESSKTLAEVAFDAATAERVMTAAKLLTKRRKSKEFAQRCAPPVFLRLLTTPVEPLALGRTVRIVPARLRNAVAIRDQHCVVPGCVVPVHRCEIHHVQPWALGGATDLENLAALCVRHHRTVEDGIWRLRKRSETDAPGQYWVAEAA